MKTSKKTVSSRVKKPNKAARALRAEEFARSINRRNVTMRFRVEALPNSPISLAGVGLLVKLDPQQVEFERPPVPVEFKPGYPVRVVRPTKMMVGGEVFCVDVPVGRGSIETISGNVAVIVTGPNQDDTFQYSTDDVVLIDAVVLLPD